VIKIKIKGKKIKKEKKRKENTMKHCYNPFYFISFQGRLELHPKSALI